MRLSPLLVADTVVMGDVNGHDEEWSQGVSDARGGHLASEVDSSHFSIMNNLDIATPPSSNSSPDVAFIHTPLTLTFDWSVSTTLNSDHFPLSVSPTIHHRFVVERLMLIFGKRNGRISNVIPRKCSHPSLPLLLARWEKRNGGGCCRNVWRSTSPRDFTATTLQDSTPLPKLSSRRGMINVVGIPTIRKLRASTSIFPPPSPLTLISSGWTRCY